MAVVSELIRKESDGSIRAVGKMKTNLGGKLTISVDADKEAVTHVKVVAI